MANSDYPGGPVVKNPPSNAVVKSESVSHISRVRLCNHMDCSPPGSSVHGILQARILQSVAIPSLQGIFLTQGSNPGLLHCRQILYHLSHQESPPLQGTRVQSLVGQLSPKTPATDYTHSRAHSLQLQKACATMKTQCSQNFKK